MHERIKQLAQEAGMYVDLNGNPWPKWMSAEECEVAYKKFAELIVNECIDKITTYDLVPGHSAKWEDIYDIHTRLLQDLGEELKEHFGVKE